jgi:peroxiredoxin
MIHPRSSALTSARLALVGGTLVLLLALVLVVPTLLSAQSSTTGTSGSTPGPHPGSLAPDFELKDPAGNPISLSSLRGKPVWLNFWASWCQGCKDEMPAIRALYDKYSPAGLQVVGINVQESPATVRDFASSNALSWLILLDSDGRITDRYFVNGLPYHVFIDPSGTITSIYPGVLTQPAMESHLHPLQK